MRRICVFDVNETLLDLTALDPAFERLFGDAAVRQMWFAQMIQSALVSTVTNEYATFGAIGGAALTMTAARRGVTLTEEDRKDILGMVPQLPPHPEVAESLARLRDANFRLVSLTNSTAQVAEAQLRNAGITDLFERILSADTVRRLKPAPEPYHMVAQEMGVPIDGIRLIAAHAWDIAGALRAGCAAAFVARPGAVLDPLVQSPDVVGSNLSEVVDQIITIESGA
jgi:2-haloacid dehalogenase